jgi:hypothetical protein
MENAFSRQALRRHSVHNCAELGGASSMVRWAGCTCEAMPVSIESPPPSAEQLADWQALIERIRQGDRSQLLAWDEAKAVGTAAAYQVLVTQLVHQRLRGAPPLLVGSVAGIIAILRVDPTEASMIFRRRRVGDAGWTLSFGPAQGLLTYWVLPAERIVVLLDLTWAE